MNKKKLLMLLLCVSGVMSLTLSFAGLKPSIPEVDKPFMDLYFDFTGSNSDNYPKGKINISQQLYQATAQDSQMATALDGPLILFINSTLYVYNDKGMRQLALLMRTSPDSGFYEMTAISHIGPALAYLAYMKEKGRGDWRSALINLQRDLVAVKKFNASKKNNWLTKVDAPAWKPYHQTINNMVDYACSMAGNYISQLLSGEKSFTITSLQNDFFQGNQAYPIPYNTVMVGTFMLTALQSMTDIHEKIMKLPIEWAKAKVLIRFVAGSNITAGVSAGSNWLVPFSKALSKGRLSDDRIYLAPYLQVKSSLGQAKLSDADYTYYNYAWSRTYSRTHIAKEVFSSIPTIFLPKRAAIPGDYVFSKATAINDFLIRLKYSLSEPTEMLSNTVAFWLAGELQAKQWILDKVELPGVTTGFPVGTNGYPNNNPPIKTPRTERTS